VDDKKLTEEEIEAIARQVATQLQQDLYINVGSGLISLAWKGLILVLLVLATYGATKHLL
jgi:hypothetical protein